MTNCCTRVAALVALLLGSGPGCLAVRDATLPGGASAGGVTDHALVAEPPATVRGSGLARRIEPAGADWPSWVSAQEDWPAVRLESPAESFLQEAAGSMAGANTWPLPPQPVSGSSVSGPAQAAGGSSVPVRSLPLALDAVPDAAWGERWDAAWGVGGKQLPWPDERPLVAAMGRSDQLIHRSAPAVRPGGWQALGSDLREFYAPGSLLLLTGGVATAAVMANTGFDENLARDTYFDNIVLAPSHEFYERLHQPKFLGEGVYVLPAFALAAASEPLLGSSPGGARVAEWGQRSLRSFLVGAPPMYALQWLTGGGRPGESSESSEWRPFQDNNGVSGHAFMGAIPLLSAAKMTDDPWLKAALLAASTLPAISRVNDDAHYTSQVALGWWLAYLAECAVDRTQRGQEASGWQVGPSPFGWGVTLSRGW